MKNTRFSNYRQLLRFKKPILNPKKRRLSRAHTIYDLRDIAKRVTPQGPFDYTDGAADQEISLNRARRAFEDIEFHPHILRNVDDASLATTLLGRPVNLPVGIAPTGFTRMMNSAGERASSSVAQELGIPFALSTMGTTSIENVAQAAPHGSNWFQLYLWRDRDKSMQLISRAAAAGFDGLILTVDAQIAGSRLRDVRNGLTVPPSLSTKTILNAIPRPAWWWNFLTKEPLTFASLDSWNGTVAELMNTMFDPTMTYEDLKWIRKVWNGKLLVKGVQRVDDAALAMKHGADAIWLSNHGGRQLDRAPVPFRLLPEVRKKLGKNAEIHLDTGIMHGADIIAALAAGADFTWIGRAYLYGLMAGGREGVEKTFSILQSQMVRTLKLLGVNSIQELEPSMVSFLNH
jgi:L-lactate dehydrogenase (cytochrome)/glycolate oxidase